MAREGAVNGLVWEEPPHENRGGGVNHRLVAPQLRANPEAWARVSTYKTAGSAGSMAQAIRTGVLTAYRPAGSFEAASRKVGGQYHVYARYVGEPDA